MTCPACHGELAPWRVVPASDPALPGSFALERCRVCGSAVTLGPDPGAEAYAVGAYGGEPRLARLAAPILAAFDRRRLRLLARALDRPDTDLRGVRLLDAGAGRGRFVAGALAAGAQASGFEPAARGVQAALHLYQIPLQQAGVADARIPDGSLDAITLWHVLEHLPDPDPALARIARWLGPGGVLLVGVPNLDSVQARLGGERWYHLDVPRHRVHYTPAGLAAALARHGLAPLHTEHVLLEHNPFGMWVSLASRVTRTPSYAYHLLKGNAPLASRDLAFTLAALPLTPAAGLLELLAGLGGRGGTIAMTATRPASRAPRHSR